MTKRAPRKLSLVKFVGSPRDKHMPFKTTSTYLFLGEVVQMPGHCVVADVETGRIWSGYHTDNFRELPKDDA